MKKILLFGLLVITLAFGLFGCDNGTTENNTKFEGIWVGISGVALDEKASCEFIENNFTFKSDTSDYSCRGTFDFTKSEIQLLSTQEWNGSQWINFHMYASLGYNFIDSKTLEIIIDESEDSWVVGIYKKQ